MRMNPSRRTLLVAMAIAPIVAAVPAAAEVGVHCAQWTAALARYEKAEAAVLADDQACAAARGAWEAAAPSEDIVHWREFPFACRQSVLSMDVDQAETHWLAAEGRLWSGGKSRMIAAFESVREYQRRRHANPHRATLDAANERNERLENLRIDAEDVLWSLAAPNAVALQWKLEQVLRDGDFACAHPDLVANALADVRRLLGPAVV